LSLCDVLPTPKHVVVALRACGLRRVILTERSEVDRESRR